MSTAVECLAPFGLAPFVRYEPYVMPILSKEQRREYKHTTDSAVLDVLPTCPQEAISTVRVAELLNVSLGLPTCVGLSLHASQL